MKFLANLNLLRAGIDFFLIFFIFYFYVYFIFLFFISFFFIFIFFFAFVFLHKLQKVNATFNEKRNETVSSVSLDCKHAKLKNTEHHIDS